MPHPRSGRNGDGDGLRRIFEELRDLRRELRDDRRQADTIAAEDRRQAAEDRRQAAEDRRQAAEQRRVDAEERQRSDERFERALREFREESKAQAVAMRESWTELRREFRTIGLSIVKTLNRHTRLLEGIDRKLGARRNGGPGNGRRH